MTTFGRMENRQVSHLLNDLLFRIHKEESIISSSPGGLWVRFLRELRRADIPGIESHQDAIEWCIQEGNSSKHADLQDDWAQQVPGDYMGGNLFGAGVKVKEKRIIIKGLASIT